MILMNKNHTDTLLVKMRGEMYLVIVHRSKTVCKKQSKEKSETENEKIEKEDRLGVRSTCFQLKRCRKRAIFVTSELKKCFNV